jgi:hypothetical protein
MGAESCTEKKVCREFGEVLHGVRASLLHGGEPRAVPNWESKCQIGRRFVRGMHQRIAGGGQECKKWGLQEPNSLRCSTL